MSVDVWIRARSGPVLGMGHRVRAGILAKAIARLGRHAGLILDADAPPAPDGVSIYRLPVGVLPPEEAAHYPNDVAPVILDLSHPTMLAALPDLVRRLKAQNRLVGVIDGLGPEAYTPVGPEFLVDMAVTPYVLEAQASERSASLWLSGPEYAVLDPDYESQPRLAAAERAAQLLVFISGTDPWALTEAVTEALGAGGLPEGWGATVVLGPGFDPQRRASFEDRSLQDARFELAVCPDSLRSLLSEARLAVLGPGLAKYEAAACGTFSLIVSPDETYAAMNRPFAALGLAQVLRPGAPTAEGLCQAIQNADQAARKDLRDLIDGAGAMRVATRIVSELFTESGDG